MKRFIAGIVLGLYIAASPAQAESNVDNIARIARALERIASAVEKMR